MKVLHLIGGGDIGGAKSHVLSLINELGKYIDVKLISFRTGAFADDAKIMGINIEVIETGTVFSDVKKVMSIIKNEGYELIHSHGAKANMVAVAVKKLTGLPVVSTVHSDYRLDYLQNIFKMFSFGLINTVALRFIDYHIGVSRNFKEMLILRRFNPSNIFTVYNGIDFTPRTLSMTKKEFLDKYNIKVNPDDIILGILARLHPVKGVNIFVKAAQIVVSQNPNVKFIIAGDGEDRKSLEKLTGSLGLTNNVFFPGFINEPYEFINAIDINVLTSLSESFPYAILEGTLYKKATISSNVGGISDLIESGKNGFLFEPGDYKKLAEHMLKLINNSSLREEMGLKIYEKASNLFSLSNMCKTQLSIYETILTREHSLNKSAKPYDAIISGYYGFNNIGDDAMLQAMIDNLRASRKDARILVLSKNPLQTRKTYYVESINRFNILKIISLMRKAKIFINGGGNLIQDNTSSRSLYYYLSMIWMAKKLGMKVMIYANGIGPLNKNINRTLTFKVINKVDVITVREELSQTELDTLNVKKPNISVTADPALTIEPATQERVSEILENEGIQAGDKIIGISVRKWRSHEKYEVEIAKLADYITVHYGVKVLFIPMHFPGDNFIIKNILAKMKEKAYVINEKHTVSEMLGIFGQTEMLIGMRLHALIFAASLGVPIVGMVYEPKVEGFMQYTGQVSAGSISKLKFEEVKPIIDQVWQERETKKQDLKDKIVSLKKKAIKNTNIAIELLK